MAESLVRQNTTGMNGTIQRLIDMRAVVVPISFMLLLVVIVLPLPTLIIDLLISANLSVAAIILLTTVYMKQPLEFSVFPPLLLGTTLFRLALNVATTRLILSADATSPSDAQHVAGEVINAFGRFVAGDSPIVGSVIFIILIIVQFVVITKGATRISEVAARFTLDAMPGKQMAIDADLTAGLIDEDTARERRDRIMREADFYGAMDGASKFVRGDAIAGIVITGVNILGGFLVGAIYKGWSMRESAELFTRLTIGDGLVSQIPSFVIAIAAGLIVARSGSRKDFASELTSQVASQPRALFITSGFLALMSVTGLPFVPMLICSGLVATMGYFVHRGFANEVAAQRAGEEEKALLTKSAAPPVDELLKVDLLEIEVGYGLVPLVNTSDGGSLLDRINMLRRTLAADIGLVLPPVRIRDNSQIDQYSYNIKIRGAIVAGSQVYPNMWLAMNSGLANGVIEGTPTKEPAFGLDAWWIDEHLRTRAESLGYTVVDSATVMMTHFTEVIQKYADELLTREEVNNLITGLKERAPKLVEEIIPEKVKHGEVQKVLQNLLRERVPIRDLETIIETMGDWIVHTRDIDVLVEYVRNSLRRSIISQYLSADEGGVMKLFCVTIDPHLEDVVNSYVDRSTNTTTITLPPILAGQIVSAITMSVDPLVRIGRPSVVLTSPQVRGPLHRIIESNLPNAAVLGYNEVPNGIDVESVNLVQLPEAGGGRAANDCAVGVGAA